MNKTSVAMCTPLGSSPVRRADAASDRIAGAVRCVLTGVMALLVFGGSALAQSPATAPTPTAENPNWCSDVPASPPPPGGNFRAAGWASIRQMCTRQLDFTDWETCMHACQGAEELWQRWKEGDFNQPPISNWPPPTPNPTKHFQVPLPGGGSVEGYSGLVPPPRGIEGPFPLPGGGRAVRASHLVDDALTSSCFESSILRERWRLYLGLQPDQGLVASLGHNPNLCQA